MNREMQFFGEAKKPVFLPGEALKLCGSMNDAIQLCIKESVIKYKRGTLADLLGIDRSQLTKIFNGKGYNFPPGKLANLMKACGNYAPLQYLIQELGFSENTLELLEKLAA